MSLSESSTSSQQVACLLWSDRQLAVCLGMSVKRVQELARSGLLPSFKVGRNWCFDPNAIVAWIKGSGKPEQLYCRADLAE
jgi:excisionase family DNA binding protein